MADLRLFAGPEARRRIAAHGLRGQDFSWLAGASGGPKWFVLYGLDRYLAGQFFADRQVPLRMVGSSAGAWRLACYACPSPLKALQTLAERYSGQTYSSKPDRHEISREARAMLAAVIESGQGDEAATFIAHNDAYRLYVIADRARHILKKENKALLNTGLAAAALSNMISRRAINWHFQRHVFHNAFDDGARELPLFDLSTRYIPLHQKNVHKALMASGSIPQIMEAVTDVSGAGRSVFRDGGITDYHLDLPYNQLGGLVLYPHFYASVTPGWFDKFVPWRHARREHFDNVLLVTPGKEFVQRLPYGKIPDRNDFGRMSESQRLAYWRAVLVESERLGNYFSELVDMGTDVASVIEPFAIMREKHV
ncbi:patatin-like phospholipase family protein [Pseudohongiella spirulinae]|uniref:Alpha/beta hydrolase n=1 Tax=Pseudohongiella spirulinae TaxID=1249552 RepID=A0A0S2KBH7_9GAMM|nr:patatin-like phospholipase family protein [Pseudohongiella spirulinae]ALO45460.1 alpha/beta hydrolase [Pseudohongiella spirulinae]